MCWHLVATGFSQRPLQINCKTDCCWKSFQQQNLFEDTWMMRVTTFNFPKYFWMKFENSNIYMQEENIKHHRRRLFSRAEINQPLLKDEVLETENKRGKRSSGFPHISFIIWASQQHPIRKENKIFTSPRGENTSWERSDEAKSAGDVSDRSPRCLLLFLTTSVSLRPHKHFNPSGLGLICSNRNSLWQWLQGLLHVWLQSDSGSRSFRSTGTKTAQTPSWQCEGRPPESGSRCCSPPEE